MISNLVSFFISSRFQKQPIYEVLANQDGIHLPTGESRLEERRKLVIHAMHPPKPGERLESDITVQAALDKIRASTYHSWPVCDKRGVIGVINLQTLERASKDGRGGKRLSELLEAPEFPHVHDDHPLHVALDRMGASQLDVLPVVSRADVHQLTGVVTLQDALAVYGLNSHESTR
jgi:CIC family chloride channel protein